MAASLRRCLTLVSHECQRFANDLRLIASIFHNPGGFHGLDFNTVTVHDQPCTQKKGDAQKDQTADILGSIFDSFVWAAVQKHRRSLERRMTRRMQMTGHFEHAVPRQDLVVDQHTGMWKEKGTVCRHHYDRVKAETKRMQEELGETMQYTPDQKEVVFLYEGEDEQRPKHKGKFVVEMKKPRPSWFCKSLLEKS